MAGGHGLSDEQVKEFKELFDSLDHDGGGHIDVDELAELFDSLGVKVSKDKVKEMFAEVDEDRSGEIDFEEFLVLVAKQVAAEGKKDPYTEAMKAFAMFDTDGSGTIDASELGAALKAMGHELSNDDIKKMLEQADDDGTGEIEFEEFCMLMGIEVPSEGKKSRPSSAASSKAASAALSSSRPSTKAPKKAVDPNEVIDPHTILSADEIKDLKEVFELFDEDRSGNIDMEELGKMMDGLGRNLSEAELKAMVDTVDADGSGEIDFEEFLIIMARDKKNTDPMDEAMKIFNMFDKDGSGAIDAEELGEALRAMGHNLSHAEVLKMMQDADDDGGGEIEFEEFCKLMGMDSGKAAEKADKAKPKDIPHPIDTKPKDELSKKQLKKKRERELAAQEKVLALKAQEEGATEWVKWLEDQAAKLYGKFEDVAQHATVFQYHMPLHKASSAGDLERVTSLCTGLGEAARDVNELDDMGWSPLMWAVSNEHTAVALYLIEFGAKLRLQDFDGRSALHMACSNGQVKVVEALVAKNIPTDPVDKYGDLPLLLAAKKGNRDIAMVLIKAKCDVNVRSRYGESALHWAAKRGHEEFVKLLLQHKADPAAMDDGEIKQIVTPQTARDTTPEHWAKRKELKEIINPPPPPPEPVTKKKIKGNKAARSQAKRFNEGLKALKNMKGGKVKKKKKKTDSAVPAAATGTADGSAEGTGKEEGAELSHEDSLESLESLEKEGGDAEGEDGEDGEDGDEDEDGGEDGEEEAGEGKSQDAEVLADDDGTKLRADVEEGPT